MDQFTLGVMTTSAYFVIGYIFGYTCIRLVRKYLRWKREVDSVVRVVNDPLYGNTVLHTKTCGTVLMKHFINLQDRVSNLERAQDTIDKENMLK